jgi:hypothetical protein
MPPHLPSNRRNKMPMFRELLKLVQRFYAQTLAAFAAKDARGSTQPGDHDLQAADNGPRGRPVMQAVFPKPGPPIR